MDILKIIQFHKDTKTQLQAKILNLANELEAKYQLINDLTTILSDQNNIKLNEQQINSFIFSVGIGSLNRLERFYFWSKYLPSHLYWKYLSEAFIMSDNLYEFKDQVKELFSSTLPDRDQLMTAKELKYFKTLPDTLTIYRAMTIKESLSKDYGISWTLDKKVAEYFRDKYKRNYSSENEHKTIIELKVNKCDLIAFIDRRKEAEVIYLHNSK